MNSPLPYANRIEYYINTKMAVEIPQNLLHDITHALYDYGIECVATQKEEAEYWKRLYFEVVDEYFKEKGRAKC
jgi:hypothetical protein